MREILFKAKRRDTEKWVEGYYMCLHGINGAEDSHFIIGERGEYNLIDPDTVCQYTGLKDDNGKKIFESDIIRCADKINLFDFVAKIIFGNPNCLYSWGWQLKIISGTKNVDPDILLWVETEMEETTSCEVIGNIFDNPELVRGVEE